MVTKEVQNIQKVVAGLVKNVSARNRDIISRRFGLSNGKRETLESIGKSYGITRERVRQIEEFTRTQLAKTLAGNKDVEKHLAGVRSLLAKDGNVMKERDLFKAFSGNEKDSAVNSSLVFLMTLDPEFSRFSENDHFHAFWATHNQALESFKDSVSSLVAVLEKNGNVVAESELVSLVRKNNVKQTDGFEATDKTVVLTMAVSKDIGKNIFGQIGLVAWAQVKPKGVRDKAYLVVKREGAPRHFRDIAKLINTASFGDGKKINVQTVHNELIKDPRFVLVGRGMYALGEWGYKSGTVKDTLIDILKNSPTSLTKAELVAKVSQARLVKENTIFLNLQDSSSFMKRDDGTYTLRKA